MIRLQYYNGKQWVDCGYFPSEKVAWLSLGGDDLDYRTLDKDDNILTSKHIPSK